MSATYSFAPISWYEISLRLGIALLIGAIIGLERETQGKSAGLRTNMLVSFGSAVIVLIPIQIGAAQQNLDVLGRAISGVVSGVGFIGGGTILRDSRVKGLTFAAAIWVSAALGISAGCGLWLLGLIGALITWVILRLVDKWKDFL
ncbi:magnesium transporter MgtC [Pleurocapsa sp. CCALA 161]|uniref:MgtC/SapB family protein n=1 Tax=Pleurocapsa sp. CCALA 161 TaxID=2107688 RepID=UPI000D06D7E8|nr:MgtC/SapB family protein [Pleurocapsa sp. CCALA 161]PSB07502.1 magnesium transporter MgtC [Pleurocapsa sp. CCALA 161]